MMLIFGDVFRTWSSKNRISLCFWRSGSLNLRGGPIRWIYFSELPVLVFIWFLMWFTGRFAYRFRNVIYDWFLNQHIQVGRKHNIKSRHHAKMKKVQQHPPRTLLRSNKNFLGFQRQTDRYICMKYLRLIIHCLGVVWMKRASLKTRLEEFDLDAMMLQTQSVRKEYSSFFILTESN